MDDTRVRIVEWSCGGMTSASVQYTRAVHGEDKENKSPCEDAKHVQIIAQMNSGNWLVTRTATELDVRGGHSRGDTESHQVWGLWYKIR